MTQRGIEELAAEVAAEIGQTLKGFILERAERVDGMVKITFRWSAPYHTVVTVRLNDSTVTEDEAVKQQIRAQIIASQT